MIPPAPKGHGGHVPGTGPNGVIHTVGAAKRGSHETIGVMRFCGRSGNPSIDGDAHGASGASLIGNAIHDPHPNPHARPFMISCTLDSISASAFEENPRVSCLELSRLARNIGFGVRSLPSEIVLYASLSAPVLMFSMLSGIPFPSASLSRSISEGGSSAGVKLLVLRLYSRTAVDSQMRKSSPHTFEVSNPTSPYISSPVSHFSSLSTIIVP